MPSARRVNANCLHSLVLFALFLLLACAGEQDTYPPGAVSPNAATTTIAVSSANPASLLASASGAGASTASATPGTAAVLEPGASVAASAAAGSGGPSGAGERGVFVQVSAGWGYSCGLLGDGEAVCWLWGEQPAPLGWEPGAGRWGGDPAADEPPGGPFKRLAAGRVNACGLRPGGEIECWGENFTAFTHTAEKTPVVVPGGEFRTIQSGPRRTCGIRADSTVECWNNYPTGGGVRYRPTPGGGFTMIDLGQFYNCGLRPGGEPLCWIAETGVELPSPDREFTALAVGRSTPCGAVPGGGLHCWDPESGWTGGTSEEGEFSALDYEGFSLCGVRIDKTLKCWSGVNSPVGEPPDGEFAAVTVEDRHACGLRASGTVECWGGNDYGESDSPPGKFTAISTSEHNSCGIRPDGEAECWGKPYPQGKITPPSGPLTAISAGWGGFEEYSQARGTWLPAALSDWGFSCGLRAGGKAECWGRATTQRAYEPDPVLLTPTGAFTDVEAGRYHACGLRAGGDIECWGERGHRYQRAGTHDGAGEGYTALSVGGTHTCGLRAGGDIECWADDPTGGTHLQTGPYTTVSAGYDHQCGILSTGQIHCWDTPGADPKTWTQRTYTAGDP